MLPDHGLSLGQCQARLVKAHKILRGPFFCNNFFNTQWTLHISTFIKIIVLTLNKLLKSKYQESGQHKFHSAYHLHISF